MVAKYSLCFFLFLLPNLFPISHFAAKPKHHHHRHHPPPPPPPTPATPPPLPQHQLNNIIGALIGAGDFNSWANMLSASDLFMLPLSATLFVPSDRGLFPVPTSSTATATRGFGFDPLIVPYHIVPERLTFSQLTLFKPLSRLPTLIPSKSILITNASVSNFTLDGSPLSHPDLYLTSAIAVHGIASLLNYTLYGGNYGLVMVPPMPPPPPPPMFGNGDGSGEGRRMRSDTGCLCGEFAFVSLIIPWVVWGIKMYGNPLAI